MSDTFVIKWPLGYQMVTKTYLKPICLPTFLYDSSAGIGSSDISDSSDSSDTSVSDWVSEW